MTRRLYFPGPIVLMKHAFEEERHQRLQVFCCVLCSALRIPNPHTTTPCKGDNLRRWPSCQ